jgi:hypothetical protein
MEDGKSWRWMEGLVDSVLLGGGKGDEMHKFMQVLSEQFSNFEILFRFSTEGI